MRWLLLTTVMATATAAVAGSSDWIFRQGYYTHSPSSGVRVTQYMPLPWIAPLPDSRAVASGYRRSRTTLRGPQGTVDDYYVVENWGNGRGGLDAEWERFHNAWRGSYLSGGYGIGAGGPGAWSWGPGYGYGGRAPGGPGYWGPGWGSWGPGGNGSWGAGAGPPPYGAGNRPGFRGDGGPGFGRGTGLGSERGGAGSVGPAFD